MVMTGGTSGFGAIAAERLTLSGNVRLILGARRPTSVGEAIPVDLTELDSVRAFATSVRERLGDTPIDALVLNAGMVLPDVTGRTVDGCPGRCSGQDWPRTCRSRGGWPGRCWAHRCWGGRCADSIRNSKPHCRWNHLGRLGSRPRNAPEGTHIRRPATSAAHLAGPVGTGTQKQPGAGSAE